MKIIVYYFIFFFVFILLSDLYGVEIKCVENSCRNIYFEVRVLEFLRSKVFLYG